ncbi:hypothetical protein R1sor_004330 [Riccia sorocarpa]|uniref:glutamate--cysteine ligase n=1 Tax=Riccia sorocarpa TaxID=122646 RepID=A0ABD3HMQ6_9MARC
MKLGTSRSILPLETGRVGGIIGTEHEKFAFDVKTLKSIEYERIAEVLEGLAQRFGWERVFENGNITELKKNGQSITLEPGGQFELSGAPLETLHRNQEELNSHVNEVSDIAEELGIKFLGYCFNPAWSVSETPVMPRPRYDMIQKYLPRIGGHGIDVMYSTCTVQVNLDFSSEEDMVRKFRVGLALQPIATAIFASSPFANGEPKGYLSYRSQLWMDYDKELVFCRLSSPISSGRFENYVDYALNVPMFFFYRKNKYMDCIGLSFKDFLNGKLPSLPGEYPILKD